MAIASAIPFPRPAGRAAGQRARAAAVAAQPGARVYSPYGPRRLARPMAVPRAGADARVSGAAALPSRLRRRFFPARRG